MTCRCKITGHAHDLEPVLHSFLFPAGYLPLFWGHARPCAVAFIRCKFLMHRFHSLFLDSSVQGQYAVQVMLG